MRWLVGRGEGSLLVGRRGRTIVNSPFMEAQTALAEKGLQNAPASTEKWEKEVGNEIKIRPMKRTSSRLLVGTDNASKINGERRP